MPVPRYPEGTVRALLNTDAVTPATRDALQNRLTTPAVPAFFQADEWAQLQAVRERLLPQPDRAVPLEPEWGVDQRLAEGRTKGWRWDGFPPDGEAYRHALRALDASATDRYGKNWAQLPDPERDDLLRAVQQGAVPRQVWGQVEPRRFFEQLLAELTECYYAHPLAQEEIGYGGMADGPGWNHLGLNRRDDRDPRPLQP